jgi:hypothetical protein
MKDWERNRALLLAESEPIVRQLLADNETKGDRIVAIGFVYEFGRGQLYFDMCANTAGNFRAQFPDGVVDDEGRWNSGDYDYPGGVSDHYGDWSRTWWEELSRLDHIAKDKEQFTGLHERVAEICCAVLVELAKRGVFSDWSTIDFNVAALLDDVQLVIQRNEGIKNLIKAASQADT